MYSIAWRAEKRTPRYTVTTIATTLFDLFDRINSWCAHVIEIPDEIRIRVLRRGTFIGLNGIIDWGGHICPSSTVGEILLWKNAQKNAEKNRTSDVMNRIIPVCRPMFTFFVWFPCVKDSLEMSLHHLYLIHVVAAKAVAVGTGFTFVNHSTADNISASAPKEARRGHGLFSTMWNRWNFFVILVFGCIQGN